MSGNNNTANPVSDRHLHAVDDSDDTQKTPATADKVWAALAADPGATTARLAAAAGVGRSTAAKILAQWGRDGTVIRASGDSTASPTTWAPTPPEDDAADGVPDNAATVSSAPIAADTAATDTTTHDTADPAATNDTKNDQTLATRDGDSIGEDAGPSSPDATPTTDDAGTTVDDPPTTPASPVAAQAKDRLRKGGLRALVEDYLAEHPQDSFGPAQIGKALSRSGGAVNNALEKLVTDGYALKTCEAPKRFAINPDKTDIATPTDAVAVTV
ncbi:hypothetical protein [Amycolatopsis sp. cmx-11-32]|uniref:hypothetical protein n=1 Tax=Amycolatopsis sp. cmx-11-32 TaxID=2785796 RepID=UPI0039E43500